MFPLIFQRRSLLELSRGWNARGTVSLLPILLHGTSFISGSFSSTSGLDVQSLDGPKRKTFTISYLVDSCGLTPELARLVINRVSFEHSSKPDLVLKLLRSHGFSDSHISSILRSYPRLLLANAEKSLLPKFKFLQLKGASSCEITDIISKFPRLLAKDLQKFISPYYDFLKYILLHDGKVDVIPEEIHVSLGQGLSKNLIRNIVVLRQLGLPQRLICDLFICQRPTLLGKERLEECVKKVVGMGFDPTTCIFVDALRTFYELSDATMKHKVDVYKSLGFSEEEIWSAFRRWPFCMKCSEEKIMNTFEFFKRQGFTDDEFRRAFKTYPSCIKLSRDIMKKKTDFLTKEMGWSLGVIAATTPVLGYSLEKRILPRCNVIRALKSKGLLEGEASIASVLTSPEKAFLSVYVMKYKALVPELMCIFTGKSHVKDLGPIMEESTIGEGQ